MTPSRTFKKKPHVVQAVRFTGTNKSNVLEFVGDAVITLRQDEIGETRRPIIQILTNDGTVFLETGDWIVKDTYGKWHSYKDDEFRKKYEEVQED